MATKTRQLTLTRTAGWGGKRKGAGRPCIQGRRRPVAHRGRGEHKAAHPVHLTLRARVGLPSLRGPRVFEVVRESVREASSPAFRVLHFSVQADHVHLIVEGQDKGALSSGIRGLVIRAARAINRRLGRAGRVWGDRYHTRTLETPREVRHAIVYVLMNFKKHGVRAGWRIDPCSSGPWFDGFQVPAAAGDAAPTRRPRTWLASVGWRRGGLIRLDEAPKPRAPRPS